LNLIGDSVPFVVKEEKPKEKNRIKLYEFNIY